MAITDNTQTKTMAQAAQPSFSSAPQSTGYARPTLSFLKLGAVGGLSRTPSSEILTKAMAALTEGVKKLVEKPWEVTMLPVDNSKETNLAFSGIVFAVRASDSPAQGVAFHTLILEDSGEAIAPRIENFRGTQFEIQRVAGDAYEELYFNTVREIVSKAFPNTRLSAMDAQVVPRGFNFEDKDAVHSLTLNAILPCYQAIASAKPEFQDMDLTAFAKDETLAVRIGFNEQQVTDYVGLPVRNDVSVTLTAAATRSNNQQQQINTQDRTKVIARAGGYIDPVWAPDNTQQNQYNFNPQVVRPKFAARMVITNMENIALPTIASQLLALTSALVLRENMNWFPYFSPRPMTNGRSVDLRDVGALNIEGNMSNNQNGFDTYIDTKAANFTAQDLGKLIQTLFVPGMFVSLRVSDCGADTWYNSVFKAAASGDAGAVAAILAAADVLTGKNFSRHYGTNESPVLNNLDVVHLGYYTDGNGVKRDLSDIDYLAIMNLAGKSDQTAGAAWSDTFFKLDQPLHLRLSARKKMIEQVTHGEVTFTGMARLVTFTNRFIDALAKACVDAHLDIKTINPSVTGDFFSQRAPVSFLSQAQVMPGQTGVFNQGWNGANGGFQDPRGFNGGRGW